MRRGGLLATLAAAACVCGGLMAMAAPAVGALPTYDGMSFPDIKDASGPEEFSWQVILGKDQELRQIDDQLAEVVYPDETVSWTISAEPAHDATGANVPTSLEVSEGDVVTLFVHHRAGNPLTSQPFVYPVVDGPGFEMGFESTTFSVPMPPPDPPAEAPKEEAAQAAPRAPRKGEIGGPPAFRLGPNPEGSRTSPELVFGTGRSIDGPVQLVAYGWKPEADSPPADFCISVETVRLREEKFGTCGVALGRYRSGPATIDLDGRTIAPKAARATTVGGRISPNVAAVRVYFHRQGNRKLRRVNATVGQVSDDLQKRLKQPAPFGFFYAKVRGLVRFGGFRVQALDASGNVIHQES